MTGTTTTATAANLTSAINRLLWCQHYHNRYRKRRRQRSRGGDGLDPDGGSQQ